jgi:hypothetical protein
MPADGTDELLAAFFAALAVEQAQLQAKPPAPPRRLPIFGGGGSSFQMLASEAGLDAFQTDTFQNDTFQ